MRPNGKPPVWRRKWMVAAFVLLCLAAIAFVFAISGGSHVPKVTVSFEGFTKTLREPQVGFTVSNASRLIVHLEGIKIGGTPARWPSVTVPEGKSISIAVPIPIPHGHSITQPPTDWVLANTRRVPLPADIEFHFRRQDTALEEAREMLDSVLQSIWISVPGLNPDSARNRFKIISEVPAEEL